MIIQAIALAFGILLSDAIKFFVNKLGCIISTKYPTVNSPFEFLKITRATKDGAKGTGIIEENSELLNIAYTTLKFEQN